MIRRALDAAGALLLIVAALGALGALMLLSYGCRAADTAVCRLLGGDAATCAPAATERGRR